MHRAFPSKRDAWLIGVLAIGIVAAAAAVWVVVRSGSLSEIVVVVALAALTTALLSWTMVATRYWFERGQLVIRSGPFSWRIPLSDIQRVESTRSSWSGPALSLDRLRIVYGPTAREILISPRDQHAFLAELERLRHGT